MRSRLFRPTSPLLDALIPVLQRLEPMRAKALMRALERIELLRRERVATMMPQEIVIR